MIMFRGARRRASLCPTRPVTPEVAGSSPVAPVFQSACNRHLACCRIRREFSLRGPIVAQARDAKCLQMINFAGELVAGRTSRTRSLVGHQAVKSSSVREKVRRTRQRRDRRRDLRHATRQAERGAPGGCDEHDRGRRRAARDPIASVTGARRRGATVLMTAAPVRRFSAGRPPASAGSDARGVARRRVPGR